MTWDECKVYKNGEDLQCVQQSARRTIRMLRETAMQSDKFCIEGHFQMRQHVLIQYCSPTDHMTKRFQIANITSESINEKKVGLCQYHYRVSCHSILMSNINCQMSQHINVKSISMSNDKCHVSNIKCRMSNQLILEISVNLMGPQQIL